MSMNPKQWTEDARQALEMWCAARQGRWLAEGADPVEVRADLEAALAQRFAETGNKPVCARVMHEALRGMDDGTDAGDAPVVIARGRIGDQPAAAGEGSPETKSRLARFFGWFGGSLVMAALWPSLVMAAELFWGICRGLFFDPLPGPWQVGIVALACLGGWLVALKARMGEALAPGVAFLRGFGVAVAGWWSLLVLPLLVIGCFGFVWMVFSSMGAGLVGAPFFLLCVLLAAAPLFLGAGLLWAKGAGVPRRASRAGLAVGVLAVLLVEAPGLATRIGMAVDSPALIRAVGSRDVLLRMCYEGSGGRGAGTDTSGWIAALARGKVGIDWSGGGDNESARIMYYRVTGTAFNTRRPPANFAGSGRGGDIFGDLDFDTDLGGDGVAAHVRDLDLASSRLDGHVDAASGLGYWEWTMVFRNTSPHTAKEARMQVLLPPDGVVSRLTLWVNGEPSEAAFSSTAKVAAAYKSVAVVQRRDPVLARWVAADRVLVQCFPVPQNGEMKIRLGVTAPFGADGMLQLPRIIERNFGLAQGLETAVWVQGDAAISAAGIDAGSSSGKWNEVNGALAFGAHQAHPGIVVDRGERAAAAVWSPDAFSENEGMAVLRVDGSGNEETENAPPGPLHLVVDGSAALRDWQPDLGKALEELAAGGHRVQVTLATDGGYLQGGPEIVVNHRFNGGVDNTPALRHALQLAAAAKAPRVIWLHGAQPVAFPTGDSLVQWFERTLRPVDLVCVDLEGGPNRLLESLGHRAGVRGGARPADGDALAAALGRLAANNPEDQNWSRVPLDAVPENAVEVWDHLARFARWHDLANVRETQDAAQAAAAAARAQLVTPWSGAVVLETRQQFEDFGLDPVDPAAAASMPVVPEPSAALLLMLGSLFFLRRRLR